VSGEAIWPLGSAWPGGWRFSRGSPRGDADGLGQQVQVISAAKQLWVTPKPRNAPPGTLLV
jgi:hypothetical protein